MNNYFSGIRTVEELRKRYRELLKVHHPDNGGDEEAMKAINIEYDKLFDILNEESKSHSQTDTYDQNAENQAFKEILNQIIGYKMEIELIGRWIWCFNCFAYKNKLKELGFKFAPKKKAWTWHYGEFSHYHKGDIPIDDIRAKYGSQKVTRQSKQKQYSLK